MAVFACALPAPLPQVLIDRGGDIKLTDFGVSTHVPESTLQVGRRLRVYVVGVSLGGHGQEVTLW